MAESGVICRIDGMEIRTYHGPRKSRFVPESLQSSLANDKCNSVLLLNGSVEMYGFSRIVDIVDDEITAFDFAYYRYDEFRIDDEELSDEEIIQRFKQAGYTGDVYIYEGAGIEEDPSYIFLGDYDSVFLNIMQQVIAADPDTTWTYRNILTAHNICTYRFFNTAVHSDDEQVLSADYQYSKVCRSCGRLCREDNFDWQRGVCISCLVAMGYDALCPSCKRYFNRQSDQSVPRKRIIFRRYADRDMCLQYCSRCWNNIPICEDCSVMLTSDEIKESSNNALLCDACGYERYKVCDFCERRRRNVFSYEVMGLSARICGPCIGEVRKRSFSNRRRINNLNNMLQQE